MLEYQKIQNLDDFFTDLNRRREQGVYCYRISGYLPEIKAFIRKYYNTARQNGVILEGGISNPTNQNLAYYQEQMGSDFQMRVGFISGSLQKWLPRMNAQQCTAVSSSIYDTLDGLRKAGKPESVLKNVYIKFMCWLYYKFERILSQLGSAQLPKILYEGRISSHELLLISVLAHAGCDVIMLEYQGDAEYLKQDPGSIYSELLTLPGMQAFPEGFSLKQIRQDIQQEVSQRRLYGTPPEIMNCTNAWLNEHDSVFESIRKNPAQRGTDSKLFYNCYCRMFGVEEKQTYPSALYHIYSQLKQENRPVIVLDQEFPMPSPQEVNAIHRNNTTRTQDMIADLSTNLNYSANLQLQRLMQKSFMDVMLEEAAKPDMNQGKLSSLGISVLCWLKKYQAELFHAWKMPELGCILYLGGCKNEKEALFLKFMARLPVDILILLPDPRQKCCLEDSLLYEQHFQDSLPITQYPKDISEIRLGTTAYHAERELDSLMYQDSGLYRNQQYGRANAVTLRTTYEEIALYWKEDVSMRPNFSTEGGIVTVPVIFAKISGVRDGDEKRYWEAAKELMAESPYVILRAPFMDANTQNPIRPYVSDFLINQRVQRDRIKNHVNYAYGFLRPEIQEHMLDKLQLLLDQKIIRGTYENGTEYTILATVLNLNLDLVREIQKFDFTKKNPKLIYIIADEKMISIEDTIIIAFLNLIGFDILFLVPTGYQCVEKFFQKNMMEEHQIGEYRYDMRVPDIRKFSGKPYKPNPFGNLFKKRR